MQQLKIGRGFVQQIFIPIKPNFVGVSGSEQIHQCLQDKDKLWKGEDTPVVLDMIWTVGDIFD